MTLMQLQKAYSLHPRSTKFIKFCPEIARALCSNNAALLMMLFLDTDEDLKTKSREFYHEASTIQQKLNIGEHEFKSARKILADKGLVSWARRGFDPKIYYRVNHQAWTEFLLNISSDLFSQDNEPDLDEDGNPVLPIGENHQCALEENASAQSRKTPVQLKIDPNKSDPTILGTEQADASLVPQRLAPERKGHGSRSVRSWDTVASELKAAFPELEREIGDFCLHMQQAKCKVYTPIGTSRWIAKYRRWRQADLAAVIEHVILRSWAGIPVDFTPDQLKPKGRQPLTQVPSVVLTAEQAGAINRGEGLIDRGSPIMRRQPE